MKPYLGVVAILVLAACGPVDEEVYAPVEPPPPPLALPPASGDSPPPIVARGFEYGDQLEAWQGSFCWKSMCADMVAPPWDELPDLGESDEVQAGFGDPGDWTVTLADEERQCARYPALLSPSTITTYALIPSGPAGEYRLDVFIYADQGGDTSGSFRWTTSHVVGPKAWAHLHQNTEFSGGMGVVRIVLDRAAVDGDVSGTATVRSDHGSETFDLVTYDQGCPGDGYVTLAPQGPTDRRIDGLGAGPYRYVVDLVVDGAYHQARATSVEGAEDTLLHFEPPLPESLRR